MNKNNTPMQMNMSLANELLSKGGLLIIAGVPKYTEFGIDLCSYTVGEDFRGVKMIPPGPHYIWCSAQGPYGDIAPRVGFIHYFKSKEIIIREWDNDKEELRERQINNPELEKQRIRNNLQQLECLLAPFDYRYMSKWTPLTESITESGVERCRPALGIIRTNIELQSCTDAERPRGKLNKSPPLGKCKYLLDEDELLPQLKPVEGTAPRFRKLPDRVPRAAHAADITRHAMDCISAVDEIMDIFGTTSAVIEELQLSFVFYFIGYSVDSLMHWRRFLSVLANSETAVQKYKSLYVRYSELMEYQLPHLPDEAKQPTERNTVYKDVRSLLGNLYSAGLHFNAERLIEKLRCKLHWALDDLLEEDPEDQPIMIELN